MSIKRKLCLGLVPAFAFFLAFFGTCAGFALQESLIARGEEIMPAARITECGIGSDHSTVYVSAVTSTAQAGTDGLYYLFELKPYEDELNGRTDYIGSAQGEALSFSFALESGTVSDRLYSRFILAIYDGTAYVPVSEPFYITNPGCVAPNQAAFSDPLTKKGLNIELDMLDDAFDLGVKHVGTNIAFHMIQGEGIDYVYDGKTYHFSKAVMESYDKIISALSGKGMTVTAILLNGWNEATPDLVCPGTQQSADAYYYMFNVQTKEGFEQTRAIAAFLAQRYNGSNPDYGKISNWVIGNEINCQVWNYMGKANVEDYVATYQKAFRVIYTAIKSTSANDRVYFSLAYWWGVPYEYLDNGLNYPGRAIVDTFNSLTIAQGQMEWGLAYHPYPYPMTEPEFWDDAESALVTDSYDTPVLNFANLNVLTDYLGQAAYRTASGEVRPVILTEQGFTSESLVRGDVSEIQAAAYAYSYYLVDSNPDIDAYILSRQVDAPTEVNQGLSFGLWSCDMSRPDAIAATKRKKIWQVFRDIDKKSATLEATEFAKEILGIEKWSEIVENFKWRNLE